MKNNAKAILRQNGIFYLTGMLIILGIKLFYSKASVPDLKWILAPTSLWVRILSGIPFDYEPGSGYVSHSFRFIIAPSCSGVQFMLIAAATLLYSFVHRMPTRKKGICWTILSFLISYIYTILVNGLRIVLSIYLPLALPQNMWDNGWMTAERLHTITGAVVYFTALFILYRPAGNLAVLIAGKPEEIQTETGRTEAPVRQTGRFSSPILGTLRKCLPPVFWYFAIALGIPFLNGAYAGNERNFTEYTLTLGTVCLILILLACLPSFFSIVKRKKQNFRNVNNNCINAKHN